MNKKRHMYRHHAAPQTQNERTSSLIRGAKCRTGARIAAFGLSALVAGQLMLPGVALASEMPEPAVGQDVAAASVADPVDPGVAGQAAVTPATTVGAPSLTAMDAEPAATPQLHLWQHLTLPNPR